MKFTKFTSSCCLNMNLLTILLLFKLVACDVQDFAEINENFHQLNDKLRSISKTFEEKLENYLKNLITTLEIFPSMTHQISDMKALINEQKAIKFPFFDDLKSCDDLKLRNASTFLSFKHFSFTDQDEGKAFNKLVEIYNSIYKSYKNNQKEIDEKMKNFLGVLDEIDEVRSWSFFKRLKLFLRELLKVF